MSVCYCPESPTWVTLTANRYSSSFDLVLRLRPYTGRGSVTKEVAIHLSKVELLSFFSAYKTACEEKKKEEEKWLQERLAELEADKESICKKLAELGSKAPDATDKFLEAMGETEENGLAG